MEKEQSTENKIIEVARNIFVTKGFNGCTTRQIAAEAGMNVALVNYYFRSKDKLFQMIFQSISDEFICPMLDTFIKDLPLEEKIRAFIEKEYEFLQTYPDIPLFLISELKNNQNINLGTQSTLEKVMKTGIIEQIEKAQKSGEMIEIDFPNFVLLFLSNCHYPIMSKPLFREMLSVKDEQFVGIIEAHKIHVVEMILNYLFPKYKTK